jgi:glycerol-3-phosphate acyltransferase PlsY
VNPGSVPGSVFAIGYLIGSIPFAYIVTRWRTGRDLRREGTGNIGTANAFEVTGDRLVGVLALLLDLLKGAVPVLIFKSVGWTSAIPILLPALILGHCYPVWLRFHGGKGLATTAGALLVSYPLFLAVWIATYFIARAYRKDIDFDSIMACGASLVALLVVPSEVVYWTAIAMPRDLVPAQSVMLSISLVVLIILTRHWRPMVAMLRGRSS